MRRYVITLLFCVAVLEKCLADDVDATLGNISFKKTDNYGTNIQYLVAIKLRLTNKSTTPYSVFSNSYRISCKIEYDNGDVYLGGWISSKYSSNPNLMQKSVNDEKILDSNVQNEDLDVECMTSNIPKVGLGHLDLSYTCMSKSKEATHEIYTNSLKVSTDVTVEQHDDKRLIIVRGLDLRVVTPKAPIKIGGK